MKIPYEKTRRLKTSEIPGVVCSPTLVFEFTANPSYQFMVDLEKWIKAPEDTEAVRLAAMLLKAVITPENNRFELGTIETIAEFIEQTDKEFIANILKGWSMYLAFERMTTLGNSIAPLKDSKFNGAAKTQVS